MPTAGKEVFIMITLQAVTAALAMVAVTAAT
jgi:hypothetical protein